MGLAVFSAVLLSFSGLVVRNIETASVAQINLYRSIALIVCIMVILTLRHRSETPLRIYRIGVPGILAGAILAFAGISFLEALSHGTVANSVLIVSTAPILAAALALVILGERSDSATLAGAVTGLVGVGILLFNDLGSQGLYGGIMALLTALAYAIFAIMLRWHRDIDMLPTILIAGVFVVAASEISVGTNWGISGRDLLLCIIWGGLLSAPAHWLYVRASGHLIAAELSLFTLLEAALAPFWVWLFVGERITTATFVGGLLIFSALMLPACREYIESRSVS